jgi:hypothetical protein
MHAKRGWVGLAIGTIVGAALAASTPLAASDPPAKEKHKQSHQTQPAAAHGGRWHDAPTAAHGSTHGAGHGGEAAHEGHASGPEVSFRGCAFFDNAGFAGRRGEIRDGASVEWLGRGWSDRISSAVCHPGCRLIGYADINYGGARRNFSGAVADLGTGWNDRISALRAVCDGAAPQDAH